MYLFLALRNIIRILRMPRIYNTSRYQMRHASYFPSVMKLIIKFPHNTKRNILRVIIIAHVISTMRKLNFFLS